LFVSALVWITICLAFCPRIGSAQTVIPVRLKASMTKLQADAKQVLEASGNLGKAKAWLGLNRDAVRFAKEMNRAFPHSRIRGDRIEPQVAQSLAEEATAYGVRVYFCEPDAAWAASNEGYFKYLEMWPTGPDADEAAWMGPAGNQVGCGDFEGSPEELWDMLQKNRSFLAQFPDSRFAAEATKRLAYAQKMLAERPN
jgi:hypothetical protein